MAKVFGNGNATSEWVSHFIFPTDFRMNSYKKIIFEDSFIYFYVSKIRDNHLSYLNKWNKNNEVICKYYSRTWSIGDRTLLRVDTAPRISVTTPIFLYNRWKVRLCWSQVATFTKMLPKSINQVLINFFTIFWKRNHTQLTVGHSPNIQKVGAVTLGAESTGLEVTEESEEI